MRCLLLSTRVHWDPLPIGHAEGTQTMLRVRAERRLKTKDIGKLCRLVSTRTAAGSG